MKEILVGIMIILYPYSMAYFAIVDNYYTWTKGKRVLVTLAIGTGVWVSAWLWCHFTV